MAGKIQSYALPGVTAQFRPGRFLRSGDGSLWIGSSDQGLLHVHQGRSDTFGVVDGLSGDFVQSIFEDHEGNVWVSTNAGLDRFREYAVPTVSTDQGLSTSNAYSVQATAEGTVWIGTANGLNRSDNGHVTVYGKRNGSKRSGRRDVGEPRTRATEITNSGFSNTPRSLGVDDQEWLWVSSGDGVFYFESGRFIRVQGVPAGNIFSIVGDGHGSTWINNPDLGILF